MQITTFDEFARSQPGQPVVSRGRYLWPNGATSDGNLDHYPPPADRYERLRTRKEYFAVRLQRDQRDYRDFRLFCEEQARLVRKYPSSSIMPPPTDAAERLTAGAARIRYFRARIANCDRVLASSPEVVTAQQRQLDLTQRQQVMSSIIGQIHSVQF